MRQGRPSCMLIVHSFYNPVFHMWDLIQSACFWLRAAMWDARCRARDLRYIFLGLRDLKPLSWLVSWSSSVVLAVVIISNFPGWAKTIRAKHSSIITSAEKPSVREWLIAPLLGVTFWSFTTLKPTMLSRESSFRDSLSKWVWGKKTCRMMANTCLHKQKLDIWGSGLQVTHWWYL